jgi:putative nucleotidyltransferase-like protein
VKSNDTAPDKVHNHVEWILRCSRIGPLREISDMACDLPQTAADWNRLFETADSHAVLPSLYRFLNESCREQVPEEAFAQLRARFIANTQSNLALAAELFKLLDALASANAPAIPFKGPALAASVYGDIGLRQFVDLDILVRKRDVFKITKMLMHHGYDPEYVLPRSLESAFLDNHYDYAFFCDKNNTLVEIHWELAEGFLSFPLDVDGLWERRKPVTLAGRQALTLSPEDSLLVLCVHGSKHLWARLGWISDVAKTIETKKDLNWRQVIERAEALGGKRMLWLGLYLANDLLGAAAPAEILLEAKSDRAVLSLAGLVKKRLFERSDDAPGWFESSKFHIKMRERLGDKGRYCLRLAVTTSARDWTAMPMPRPLFFLYYLLRPLRLAGKHGLKLLKRLL